MEGTLLGQQAARLHEVDPLTGTGSRDSLIALLDVLRERGTLHSIVILDIDGFREHNRKHGRAHGDRLLTALAAMISRECRDGDALVRSGPRGRPLGDGPQRPVHRRRQADDREQPVPGPRGRGGQWAVPLYKGQTPGQAQLDASTADKQGRRTR